MESIIKFVLSFFKAEWVLSDYPVRLQNHRAHIPAEETLVSDFPAELDHLLQWSCEIPGWDGMSAFGNTPEEAEANLVCKFNNYRMSSKPLPRVGNRYWGYFSIYKGCGFLEISLKRIFITVSYQIRPVYTIFSLERITING